MKQIIADGYIKDEGTYFVYELISIASVTNPFGQLFQVTKDLEIIPGGTQQAQAQRITRWPPKP